MGLNMRSLIDSMIYIMCRNLCIIVLTVLTVAVGINSLKTIIEKEIQCQQKQSQ